VFNF